jgi:ABC-2 type transport system permease protein
MSLQAETQRAIYRPSLARLSWARTVIEVKQFSRVPEQVFFTFLLPLLFLVVFAAVFDETLEAGPDRVKFVQYFLPGIIASGVMSSTFASLAISISIQQNEGLLKRLSGTPLPKTAFIIGKVSMAVVVTVLQTVIMLALAVLAFDAEFPAGLGRWGVFLAVLVLSGAVGSALGIAYTRAIRNASAAVATVQPPFLVLQFISGVFFRWGDLPGWLQAIASVFPLKWMASGFRYAFLPDSFGRAEYGGDWGWERAVVILAGWLAAGLALAIVLFRWDRDRN